MKRILWVSKHPVLNSQLKALEEYFNDKVVVDMDPAPFDSAETIITRFRQGKYDDIVVVAPLSVISKMCETGVKPLWAEMEEVSPEQAETVVKGRFYRFKRFRRIKEVRVVFED